MQIAGQTDDSYPGSDSKRVFYTIELESDKVIDVMVSKESNVTYVMQNEDGSMVYSSDVNAPCTYPEYEFDEGKAIMLANEAFEREYGPSVMTEERMKQLIEKAVSFGKLEKDAGITVFYSEGDFEIGISFESLGECGEKQERYIYNLFCGSNYINVSGCGTKEAPIPNEVVNELVHGWNHLLSMKLTKDIIDDLEDKILSGEYEWDSICAAKEIGVCGEKKFGIVVWCDNSSFDVSIRKDFDIHDWDGTESILSEVTNSNHFEELEDVITHVFKKFIYHTIDAPELNSSKPGLDERIGLAKEKDEKNEVRNEKQLLASAQNAKQQDKGMGL